MIPFNTPAQLNMPKPILSPILRVTLFLVVPIPGVLLGSGNIWTVLHMGVFKIVGSQIGKSNILCNI
jgi:hypothetical protein